MTRTVSVAELREKLSAEYLKEPLIVTSYGRPIAEITPITARGPRAAPKPATEPGLPFHGDLQGRSYSKHDQASGQSRKK